jgi:hypothetical protein
MPVSKSHMLGIMYDKQKKIISIRWIEPKENVLTGYHVKI